MQIPIKIPGGPGQCPEWAIIDLQGGLETRNNVSLNGRFIGDLHFTHKNVPVLIIGHHILYGKLCDLEKPFAVLTKKHSDNDEMPDQNSTDQLHTDIHYLVKAIIRKRLLFKTRPKPIIANVPKKL
ncbi:chromosome transmission fidelity protein 8 homolog [Ylistrum balloti]|uniref:chromosome transmission fidelity protein 8 homolog n=1 Tax=Ylistrum balloti TaxID=509963 RepID=UPI0029058C08|nr:chromosome transmission fidelity protein 8 homolog [Ylistrum balloti]